MHAGVDARVGDERRERAERIPAAGDAAETPVVNANADAECRSGNEFDLGISTWRATGSWCVSRSGRPIDIDQYRRMNRGSAEGVEPHPGSAVGVESERRNALLGASAVSSERRWVATAQDRGGPRRTADKLYVRRRGCGDRILPRAWPSWRR